MQSLTHSTVIEINDTYITIMHTGCNTPKNKRFNKNVVLGISFENYVLDGREVFPSLNILFTSKKWGIAGQDREPLATWMRTKEKYQLFLLLQHILQEREWDIKYQLKD